MSDFFALLMGLLKLCSNPDISGPGVRIALYLQSLLSSSCPTYFTNDVIDPTHQSFSYASPQKMHRELIGL